MGKERDYYKSYIISISLVISLCTIAIFSGIAWQTRRLVTQDNLVHARALYNSIVLARKWNASYGGVFVEKRSGVTSSPYLPGTDISTRDGRTYVLRNPALMVREISDFAEKGGSFRFHMTSLTPVNPQNIPDDFERRALVRFEEGEKEVHQYERHESGEFFEYIAPLYVEEECLSCHREQGYSIGDVRGGISVSFSVAETRARLRDNMIVLAGLGVLTLFLLLGTVYFITDKFFSRLKEARERIETLAVTDGLTGLSNRRHLIHRFEEEFGRAKRLGRPLSCIIIDIDHFKAINDRYGHLVGDEALRYFSSFLSESVRSYDVTGRFGGEEFLVILPDTVPDETMNFAERIRESIKERIKTIPGLPEIDLTISLGVASLTAGDESIDDMIRRADDGLYQAKSAGRDRVGRT